MPFHATGLAAEPIRRPARRLTTGARLSRVMLAVLGLMPGAANAASFALACTGPAMTVHDGFGAREDWRERQPTMIYVMDDVAQRVEVVAPGGRTPEDLCVGVQHCTVDVTADAISFEGTSYAGIAKLSSRLAIDRTTGRGVRERVIDHENLDAARSATPLRCTPAKLPVSNDAP